MSADGSFYPANAAAAFVAFLAHQREEYRYTLPERLQRIEALWMEACADPKELLEVERLVHGIAGTAATFGYAALSDAARRLERELQRLRERGRRLSAAEQLRVAYTINELHLRAP